MELSLHTCDTHCPPHLAELGWGHLPRWELHWLHRGTNCPRAAQRVPWLCCPLGGTWWSVLQCCPMHMYLNVLWQGDSLQGANKPFPLTAFPGSSSGLLSLTATEIKPIHRLTSSPGCQNWFFPRDLDNQKEYCILGKCNILWQIAPHKVQNSFWKNSWWNFIAKAVKK